jgi:Tol biopolymer transport system component
MVHDVSANRNVEVLKVENTRIYSAQVSPDGQWVLLIVGDWKSKASYELQRVRINGQQHETLYAFPPSYYGFWTFRPSLSADWSLDQKSVLIATDRGNATSTLSVLDMTTRKVRTALQITSAQYGYYVVKWLDRTHVYVVASGRYHGQEKIPPTELYLLDVTTRQVRRASDLKLILPGIQGASLDFDSSPDGKRLFVAQRTQDTITIWVEPATGGRREILSHIVEAPFHIDTLRVFTNYLLLTVNFGYDKKEVWRMPLDASSHITLFRSTDYTTYVLNRMTQYSWSNVSRDGMMLAVETYNLDIGPPSLFVSPIHEGKATVFWNISSFIVGWTTI